MMELRCLNCRLVLVFVENGFQDGYSVQPCKQCNPKLLGGIQAFAEVMDVQLRSNTISKNVWKNRTNLECITAAQERVESLSDACVNQETPIDVCRKVADTALFLCFLAENYARKGK